LSLKNAFGDSAIAIGSCTIGKVSRSDSTHCCLSSTARQRNDTNNAPANSIQ